MIASSPIRVCVVDDHPIVCDGIAFILSNQKDIEVIGQLLSGRELVDAYDALNPDVTLIDLSMPGMTGIEAIRAVRKLRPEARFIVLTVYWSQQDIRQALEAGARGYLLKDASKAQIIEAVRSVHRGLRCIPPEIASQLAEYLQDDALTPRELAVLQRLAEGKSNKEIARVLGVTSGTIHAHIHSILTKLHVENRTQAVTAGLQKKLIKLP